MSILFLSLILVSCALTNPYHLTADTAGTVGLDVNSSGMAFCASFPVKVEVQRVVGGAAVKLGGFTHEASVGAGAYHWGRDESGWFVERLSDDEGALLYPTPFDKCRAQSIAGLRTKSNRSSVVLWREVSP